MLIIQKLTASETAAYLPALMELLRDSVENGGSVGFLPPLNPAESTAFWQGVFTGVAAGSRILLIAKEAERVVGSVQLDLCQKGNGLHRAEVMKLLVHTTARRRGIGRALMQAIEAEARVANRITLVLDTRQGDPSEKLYQSLGWHITGAVPQYARNPDGSIAPTVIYYKLL